MPLDLIHLAPLAAVFFLTSMLSVVTGSTSLITVPVLLMAGIEPRAAVATNMFALVFMSAGGVVPFLGGGYLDRCRLPNLIWFTVSGSLAAALLLSKVSSQYIPGIIGAAMIGVAVFLSFGGQRVMGLASTTSMGRPASNEGELVGMVLTFLLGIYGGLFSGGYITLLTAVFLSAFGQSMPQAIATTKLVNVASSASAAAIFAWYGLIQYQLGLILGITMLAGGYCGAMAVLRLPQKAVRWIFLATVWVLALRSVFITLRS